jgi:EAL domain-containing protein (putative c-di-GMP-specific phosphodiesterase class I)
LLTNSGWSRSRSHVPSGCLRTTCARGGCNIADRVIVKATIDNANAVGLTVVAEGVETREQAEALRGFGCDRAQGFVYARPKPAPAITDVLAAAPR